MTVQARAEILLEIALTDLSQPKPRMIIITVPEFVMKQPADAPSALGHTDEGRTDRAHTLPANVSGVLAIA